MNKYLLEILKEANTIIIPGLGALTITNKEKNEIMFMPYLKHDDGKLSTYISEKDGMDETESKNIVAKFVREIQASLDKGESYDMFQFGTFSKVEGEIVFQAWRKHEQTKETPTSIVTPPVEDKIVPETKEEIPSVEVPKAPEPIKEEPIKEEPKIEVKPITPPPTPSLKEETPAPVREEKTPVSPVKPMNIVQQEELSKNVEKLDELKQKSTKEKPSVKVAAPIATVTKETTKSAEVNKESLRKDTPKVIKEKVKKEEEEKKRGVGFWILSIFLVALIAGGTYFGMNYNTLKQHIPFLADEVITDEVEPSPLDEMEALMGEEEENSFDEAELDAENDSYEESPEEAEGISEVVEEEAPVEIVEEKVIEEPKPVKQEPVYTPQSSGSSNGAYKVIAGVFSSEENAQRLAAKFQAQGLPSSTFVNANGLHVVCMKTFDNSSDANAEISSLRAISPGAWVMHRP